MTLMLTDKTIASGPETSLSILFREQPSNVAIERYGSGSTHGDRV